MVKIKRCDGSILIVNANKTIRQLCAENKANLEGALPGPRERVNQ